MKKTLYFAYGANTNTGGMDYRCPAAEPIGKAVLPQHRLVFRGVADVVPCKTEVVEGVLWEITAACEESLDRFEGYPSLYIKKTVRVRTADGRNVRAMVYVMRESRWEGVPGRGYYDTLHEGYAEFGCDPQQIERAVEAARKASRARQDEFFGRRAFA